MATVNFSVPDEVKEAFNQGRGGGFAACLTGWRKCEAVIRYLAAGLRKVEWMPLRTRGNQT